MKRLSFLNLFRGAGQKPQKTRQQEKQELYYASQWQLVWRRFKRHQLGPISLVGLSLLYAMAIFCEFLSPYGPRTQFQPLGDAPPTKIHLFRVDENGQKRLTWPYVYGYKSEFDPETIRRRKVPDETRGYPVRLFTRGEEYLMWGLFKMDLHLFGTANNEGQIFLFGTDDLARDIFTRTLYGSRISLTIGLIGVAITMVLGLIIGGLAGYYGGALDEIIMRAIDFLISIPTLPLWMSLSAALPRDWPTVKTYFAITIIFSVIGWTGLARTVRGWLLALREEDFTTAARVCGASEWRIVTRHLLPLFMTYIIVSLALSVPGMILGETSLSFIGLGLQPPAVSWGVILKDAQQVVTIAHTPWKLIPGIFVIYVVLLFNFLGNGLRDAADPYHV